MRELSVYYCEKCGYYAYYQLPKNAVCHKCKHPMKLLDMKYQDFMNLNYEQRDYLIIRKMIEASDSLTRRLTALEKLYHQRELVGALTQRIHELEEEVNELNETINWMHSTIWDELKKKQALKEEVETLKEKLASKENLTSDHT